MSDGEDTVDLRTFIDDVAAVVAATDDEHEITALVGERLSALLASGYRLPPELTRPSAEHHVNYPLHIAPDGSWSLAAVVWSPGQNGGGGAIRWFTSGWDTPPDVEQPS